MLGCQGSEKMIYDYIMCPLVTMLHLHTFHTSMPPVYQHPDCCQQQYITPIFSYTRLRYASAPSSSVQYLFLMRKAEIRVCRLLNCIGYATSRV